MCPLAGREAFLRMLELHPDYQDAKLGSVRFF